MGSMRSVEPELEPPLGERGRHPTLALWGLMAMIAAIMLYATGVVMAALLLPLPFDRSVAELLVWVSGAPLLLGIALVFIDAAAIAPRRRRGRTVHDYPLSSNEVTAVLTAFNDEQSIGAAVDDFLAQPQVKRLLVVDNNSSDATAQVAAAHGAIVHVETRPGYGHCVHRALTEASAYRDTELVALCEGDMTFRASDLDRLLAYARNAHVVNGTRIVEQLRENETQLTSFMFYGNFVGGKLLEAKHLGRGTVTDVGTTYKVCRSNFLRSHLHLFDPAVNLEFNAHFLDRVLASGAILVEVPVTFHRRVGQSKGGNASNPRAVKVGLRMLIGIALSWRLVRSGE